jgi:uncharacterized membrane protein
MHIGLAVVGALLAGLLGGEQSRLFHAVLGALIGFGIAELSALRARLRDAEAALRQLKHNGPSSNAAKPPERAPPAARVPPPTPEPSMPLEATASVAHTDEPPIPRSEPRVNSPTALPNPAEELWQRLMASGNLLVRTGIVVLFFGAAFLIRYAAQHTRIPIEARLCAIAIAALVLLGLGWRLRKRRPGYALALQGGAVGILYLIVFAALRIYALMPSLPAFALLVIIAVATALLAVRQGSESLALLAVIGGFLAPVLAPTAHGSHEILFSYYLVLNAGILLIAWFRAWRGLNLAGFTLTFGVGTAWGVLTYRPADFATTEPFLAAFFLFYVGIATLFTSRQPLRSHGYVDATLVFATPLIAFVLQSFMLMDRHAMAYSAVAISATYLLLAALLWRSHNEVYRGLIDAFLALGVVFFTLAIPLRLGSHWNVGVWALEGSGLVWFGCRQDRRLQRAFGALLIWAAGCLTLQDFNIVNTHLSLALVAYLPVLLVSIASMLSAKLFQAQGQRSGEREALLAEIMLCFAILCWVAGGLGVLPDFISHGDVPSASLILLCLTGSALGLLHRRLPLDSAIVGALSIVPIMSLFALGASKTLDHPAEHAGWLAWPLSFAAFYLTMGRIEVVANRSVVSTLHVLAVWLATALVSWELAWLTAQLLHGSAAWPLVLQALPSIIVLVALPRATASIAWPFVRHRAAYLAGAGLGCAAYLVVWQLVADASMTGDVAPLPYVPILNPIDLAQLTVLFVLARYWKELKAAHPGSTSDAAPLAGAILLGLPFLWINALLLRTLHQWAGVPFSVDGVVSSTLTQTSLTITWTLIAIGMMLAANRKLERPMWFAGAGLLAVVTLKLFLIDLSREGSIERIVSFVGVGTLMLIVGYFSPLPPRSRASS